MTNSTLYLGLVVLVVALVLFWLAARQRRQTGLPGGRIIYTDTRTWKTVEKPLYDSGLGLTGKPDYLVEQNGIVIPIEVKTGRPPDSPYDAHIYQLAAYCLLVEKTYGKRPPYGILHYPGRDFAVDYTEELEGVLLDVLADLRRDEHRSQVRRSHEEPVRCVRCGFRRNCDERLR